MNPGDKVKTSLGPGRIVSQAADGRYLVKVEPMIKSTYFRTLQSEDGGIYFSKQTLMRMNQSGKQIDLNF